MGRRRQDGPVSVRIPEIGITRSARASENVQLPSELLLLFSHLSRSAVHTGMHDARASH